MKFTISILTHSALNLAKQSIESVRRNSVGHEYDLILTANGNEMAAEYFHSLRPLARAVIVNDENRGFIEPNRLALERSDSDLFVMLNDDATVPPGWLDRLEEPFKVRPDCAISGPMGCLLDRNFVGWPTEKLFFDYIEGSCLCVRSDLAKKHDLFSPELKFAYCEDADLCLRMRELGYSIARADFKLRHAGGATSATVSGLRDKCGANFEYCRKRWAEYLGFPTPPAKKEFVFKMCQCGAEAFQKGGEFYCMNPDCTHLESYHRKFKGYK